MANTGNLGDAAIRQGTLQLFSEINLDYEEVQRIPEEPIGTFVYGGGGAWCRYWDNSYRIAKVLDHAERVIVLPSTFAVESPLYADGRVSFFSRDREESLRYCPRAVYHRDMAFCLEDSLWPLRGKGVGFFMRTDVESSGRWEIPSTNIDISLWGSTFDDIEPFVQAINAVEEVHTDRLHVSIFACMLGKKVVLYEGGYFKNKAIYLSTLKGRYDVTFREYDRREIANG